MASAARQPASWSWAMVTAAVAGAVAGVVAWQLRLHAIDDMITHKRSAMKQLQLKGVPPDPEVVDYLTNRETQLESQYREQLAALAPSLPTGESQANSQLYFQERVHDIQQTLDHLATAQGLELPTVLGLPKELPPVDAVPRFLTQLGIIEDTAKLLAAVNGISQVRSFKVDDPQPVPAVEGAESFLVALPVRIRLTCSLQAVSRLLGVLDRATPAMDLAGVRIVTPPTPPSSDAPAGPASEPVGLDVELVVARYQVTAPELGPSTEEPATVPAGSRRKPAAEAAGEK